MSYAWFQRYTWFPWLLLTVAAFWYVFFEPAYLSYPTLPFPLATQGAPVRAGDPVLLVVERCNSSKFEKTYPLSHALVNLTTQERVVLTPGLVSVEAGCTKIISTANIIPKSTVPGAYRVEGFAEVQATVRTISIPWYSEPFEVVAGN